MRKVLPTYNSYVAFLIANCKLTYKEVITKIADYTADENFSIKDIEYLSNLGISNIRNENEEFKRNNRLARRIHCALVEYCIESYGIEKPASFKDLRNDTYLKSRTAESSQYMIAPNVVTISWCTMLKRTSFTAFIVSKISMAKI